VPDPPASGGTASSPAPDLADADWSEVDHTDPKVRKWLVDHPGAPWSEWFYRSFAKTYGVTGLFVGDAIVVAFWLEVPSLIGLFATLLPLLYLEYVLYQYLWYEPGVEHSHRSRSTRETSTEPRRPWVHPFPFGRWSSTGLLIRQGLEPIPTGDAGPDPREFL
jgi:hypothetical protein